MILTLTTKFRTRRYLRRMLRSMGQGVQPLAAIV